MISVAEAFKRFRTSRGYSQQAIAERIGVKQGSYTAYENKGTAPTVEKLRKMACEFGVSTDYLLGLTDDPRPVDEILAAEKPAPVAQCALAERLSKIEAELAELKKLSAPPEGSGLL